MSEALRTAVLIDGSKDPPAIRIEESERKPFISQGRAGQKPRNFQFVKVVEQQVENEDEPRKAYLYRLVGSQMSDEDFKRLAAAEVDKHLNPEKYAGRNDNPDAAAAELAEYRRRFGPLKKEG
jgi:hypothetical protein